MAVIVGRPINGISINGLEYVLNENGEPIKFATEKQARLFIEDHGITEKEIEETGIVFVDAEQEEI